MKNTKKVKLILIIVAVLLVVIVIGYSLFTVIDKSNKDRKERQKRQEKVVSRKGSHKLRFIRMFTSPFLSAGVFRDKSGTCLSSDSLLQL